MNENVNIRDIAKQIEGVYTSLDAVEFFNDEFAIYLLVSSLVALLLGLLGVIITLFILDNFPSIRAVTANTWIYIAFYTVFFSAIGASVMLHANTSLPYEVIWEVDSLKNTPKIKEILEQEGFVWEGTQKNAWEKYSKDYILTPDEKNIIQTKANKVYLILFILWFITMFTKCIYIMKTVPDNFLSSFLIKFLPKEKRLKWKRKNSRYGISEEEKLELFHLCNQKLLKDKQHVLYIKRIIKTWEYYTQNLNQFNREIEIHPSDLRREYSTHEKIVATKHLVSFQVIESLLGKSLNKENKNKINKIIELYYQDLINVKDEINNLEHEISKAGQERISELLEHEINSFKK